MTERYHIISSISSDQRGTISRGWDRSQNRDVVVRRLPLQSSGYAEFRHEARLLYGLRNPHLVLVYDYDTDDEGAYLITERIQGDPLEMTITKRPLSEEESFILAGQILEGLRTVHEAGLLHRGVNPSSLIMPWDAAHQRGVKITDFSLASAEHVTISPMDSKTGIVAFMAPEQFGTGVVDGRTDLYSTGVTLYYALTQQNAFQGETNPQIIIAHLQHHFVPLNQLRPDLPAAFCQWVENLMSLRPYDRPASAQEALHALQALIEDQAVALATPILEEEEETMVLLPVQEEVTIVPEEVSNDDGVAALDEVAETPRIRHEELGSPEEVEIAADDVAVVSHDKPAPSSEGMAVVPLMAHEEVAVQEEEEPLIRHQAAKVMEIPQVHTPHSMKNPTRLASVIVPFVILMIGVGLFVGYLNNSQQAERLALLEELRNSDQPQGSDLEVRMLLNLTNSQKTRDDAARVLSRMHGGEYIDTLILEQFRENRETPSCAKLVEVIGLRRIHEAFPEVLALMKTNYRGEVRDAVWEALGQITEPANMPALLEGLNKVSEREQPSAERAIATAVETSSDPERSIAAVVQAYHAAAGNVSRRAFLLNVLARIGGPEALKVVTEALEDPAVDVRLAAIPVLAEYPTHDLLPALTTRFVKEPDETCRVYLLSAATQLIVKPGALAQHTLFLHAQVLYENAKNPDEKRRALKAISRVVAPATATFFETFPAGNDPELAREAAEIGRAFRSRLANVVVVSPTPPATPAPSEVATYKPESGMGLSNGVLTNWSKTSDWASWLIQFPQGGNYEIAIYQSHASENLGVYEVLVAGQSLVTSVEKTKDSKDFKGFVVGTITIDQPGIYRLLLRPKTIPPTESLFNVSKLAIKPL